MSTTAGKSATLGRADVAGTAQMGRINTRRFPDMKVRWRSLAVAAMPRGEALLVWRWSQCSIGTTCYTLTVHTWSAYVRTQAMVDSAHSKGLLAGWYFNNCYCRDSCSSDACFEGDVHAAVDFGFDRCGPGCTVVSSVPPSASNVYSITTAT